MPPLLNPRHERFAQELANGTHQSFAYIAAGFKANPRAAGVNASRLLKNADHGPRIRARVEEILAEKQRSQEAAQIKAVDDLALSKEWVLARLIENANRCMQAVEVCDAEGNPTGIYKHQPGPANRALELLGKEIGMFRDGVDVVTSADADLEAMTPEERAREAERIARVLGLAGGGLGRR